MNKVYKLAAIALMGVISTTHAILDTITLQEGLNGYSGTSDTYISQGAPAIGSNQGTNYWISAGRC